MTWATTEFHLRLTFLGVVGINIKESLKETQKNCALLFIGEDSEVRALVDVSVSDTQFSVEEVIAADLFVLSPKGPATGAVVLVGSPFQVEQYGDKPDQDGTTYTNNYTYYDSVCVGQPSATIVGVITSS